MRQGAILILIGLVLWGVVLWDARDAVQPQVPWLDERIALRRAEGMRQGILFGEEGGWVQPPGYPALLALSGAVAPPETGVYEEPSYLRPWQLAQIAAWLGIALFLLAAGSRLLGADWGWLPALLFALFADGWILALRPLPEIWLALAAAATLWLTLRAPPSHASPLWIGLLAGLASLLRGHAFVLALPALLPLLRARRWMPAAKLLFGLCAPLALAAAVHSVQLGGIAGISTNAGINLYIGNGPDANGLYNVDERYDFVRDPAGRSWLRELGRDAGGSLTEVDRQWRSLLLEELRERPLSIAGLVLRKLWLQLAGLEIPQIDGVSAWRRFVPALHLFFLPYGVLSLLALAGLSMWRRPQLVSVVGLGLLLIIAVQSLFFVTGRFRLIFLPHLCLLASATLVHAVHGAKLRRLLPALLLSALAVVPWGLGGMRTAMERGVEEGLRRRWSQLLAVRYAAGREEEVLSALERWAEFGDGLRMDERSGLLFLKTLSEAERHDEAVEQADALRLQFPESVRVGYARILAYIRAGRPVEAERLLRESILRFPDDQDLRSLHERLLRDLSS